MSTFDRIVYLLESHNKKQKDLTDYLGISKNQFTDWKSGRIKSYNKYLNEIAAFFGTTVDYLLTGKISQPTNESIESEIERLYSKLDNDDKNKAKGYINCLLDADKYKKKLKLKIINATYFDTPVSAGTGIQLDYTTMKTIQIIGDEPPKYADYVLRISGNSMEPKFSDGDFIFVQKTDVIEYGDIGIFYLGGDVYMKKYTHDGLESLNHEYDLIPADEEVKCLGKVLRKVRGEVTL